MMTKAKKLKAHTIIHAASAAAGGVGAGLAQLPCADSIPLSGIQVTMIISLGGVFDAKITKTAAQAIVLAFAASYVGRSASQLAVGWIPGAGNAVNATTAVALTEALGWYVVRQFAKRKTLDEIISDAEQSRDSTPDSEKKLPSEEDALECSSEEKRDEFDIQPPIFHEEDLEVVIEEEHTEEES